MAVIVVVAFFCELVDSTLGGGFGTILTPVLLLMGYPLMEIVPAILVSEVITGFGSAIMHHKETNVDFKEKTQFGVTTLLAVCSVIGVIGAKYMVLNVSKAMIKLYIGILVTGLGLIILLRRKKNFTFSPIKIFILGIVASFNKALSGGGYGPLIMSGQVVSGVKEKNAIGITGLAEGITCLTALVMYYLTFKHIDLHLFPYISIGAVISIPFAAKWVRRINVKALSFLVGLATTILGGLILWKLR